MAAVDLNALGVQLAGTRRTRTGAVLLEVRGSGAQADSLKGALKEHDVRVHRPVMTVPVMLLDVEEWTEEGDVQRALLDALRRPEDKSPPEIGPVVVRENSGGQGGGSGKAGPSPRRSRSYPCGMGHL